MIEILIALVVVVVVSFLCITKCKSYRFLKEVVAPFTLTVGFVGLIIYSVFMFNYMVAGYKAEIINREFGTNYTQQEIFYASSVVDKIQEIQRKRIETNCDLIEEE